MTELSNAVDQPTALRHREFRHAELPPRVRVVFLFTRGRRARLNAADDSATEHFYGYAELAAWGWDVDLVEEADLATAHKTMLGRVTSRAVPRLLDINVVRVAAVAGGETINRLNRYRVGAATNHQLRT